MIEAVAETARAVVKEVVAVAVARAAVRAVGVAAEEKKAAGAVAVTVHGGEGGGLEAAERGPVMAMGRQWGRR